MLREVKCYALRNLCTHEITECLPWDFPAENLAKVPPDCFADKKLRDKWANTPATVHQMYTGICGLNPNLRIGKENPPHDAQVIAIDVDCKLSRAELDGALERMGDRKPNYIETTFSGHFRLVWILGRPINFLDRADYAKYLLERLHELLPYRQVPNIDEGAVGSATRYYTNGCRWEKIHDVPVPSDLVLGWEMAVSKKFSFQGPELIEIPLEIVAPLLKEKYPRFAEWDGDFVVDSMGPTFWEPESTSPRSAIANTKGIRSFAQHADHHAFMSWADFFGIPFVKEFQTKQMGAAVDGIYFDNHQFIYKNLKGEWMFDTTDSLSRHLRVERSISDRRPKGANYSPLDEAIIHIRNHGQIASAGSFAFYPKGLMPYQGKRFLNVHTIDVLPPAPGTQKWGDNFPFIAKFYDGWLTSGEALDSFISYASYAYRCAYNRDPQPGPVSYFIGPPCCGKTLNTRYIIGALFNGYAECQDWIMGRDSFNSELWQVFIWALDDNSLGLDQRTHRLMTEMLKRACANQAFRSNEKYRAASLVDWAGRILASCNDDPDSLRAIPEIGMGNLDKLNLFRCVPVRTDGFVFPERPVITKILAKELPYFAKYLMDYEIPDRLLTPEKRYGPKVYHDPSVITEANQSSQAAGVGEQLDEWMRIYFTEKHPARDCWEGTAYQLFKSMMTDCSMGEAIGRTSADQLGKMLPVLAMKGFDIKVHGNELRRLFTICRGKRYPKNGAKPVAETTDNPYTKQ